MAPQNIIRHSYLLSDRLLEQANLQFLAYLKTKKPYSQMDMSVIEAAINFFVADRLLVIAYSKSLLSSEEVKK